MKPDIFILQTNVYNNSNIVTLTNWLAKISPESMWVKLCILLKHIMLKVQSIKANSKYAQHIFDTGHYCDHTEGTMKVLHLLPEANI
jgi:hypothetical protein